MSNITRIDKTEPARSPFLPGTKVQFAWDSTSLGYLKTCPRLYQYIMIEGWGSAEESIHLRFGIEYHKALEGYDHERAKGLDHNTSVRNVLRDLLIRTSDWDPDVTTKAGQYKNRKSLSTAVLWYLDKYNPDPAKTYILKDGTPAVELSFRFELEWGPAGKHQPKDAPPQPYLLSGHLDRVVEFSGDLFVMDRKTSLTTLSDYYFSQFQPNNQMTLYSLASRIILQAPIKGAIIDACQILLDYEKTHIPGAKFLRRVTYRTEAQLDEWRRDLRYWLTLAEAYASENYWPMNDTACDKYGGCRFRQICAKSPQVREQFLKAHFTQLPPEERWNPLKPR